MNNIPVLEIKSLKAVINNNEILKNFNLKIHKGEIHAIMGPNGSGKSTFSKVSDSDISSHSKYDFHDNILSSHQD